MPKICPRYAGDMPEICSRYAQDMPKIRPRYSQDMPKKCPGAKERLFLWDFSPYSVTGRILNITDETKCCTNIVIFCKLFIVSASGEGEQSQAKWPGKHFAKSVSWSNTFYEFVELIVHLKIYIEHF